MSEPIDDFRRRTARVRRQRTAHRLVQALFDSADQVGLRAVTVESVLAGAGMSRGSFYRHFATLDDLLDHVGGAVGAQVNSEMSARFDDVDDAAVRIAANLRYVVLRSATDRVCADLVLRLLGRDGALSDFEREHALLDFRHGVATGRFDVPSASVALDLGHGMMAAILRRAVVHGPDTRRLRAETEVLLRACGLSAVDARAVAARPAPRRPRTDLRALVVELASEQPT